jgi:hypothetical protein
MALTLDNETLDQVLLTCQHENGSICERELRLWAAPIVRDVAAFKEPLTKRFFRWRVSFDGHSLGAGLT